MNTFAEGQLDPGNYTGAGRPVLGDRAQFPARMAAVVQPGDHDRWVDKATAMMAGWRQVFGETCSVPMAVLACAVAEHETRCGDAWPGEHNWGAVQRRSPSPQEAQVLLDAKVQPKPQNVAVARKALADAVAAGRVQADTSGALHVDSSPGRGWYWKFFWAFDNDAHGAAFFAGVLAGKYRPACKPIVEAVDPGDWAGHAFSLAGAMYATGYYEGFHVPAEVIQLPGGGTRTGAQQNVLDYAGAVTACAKEAWAALAGWAPQDADLQLYAETANLQAFDQLFTPDAPEDDTTPTG